MPTVTDMVMRLPTAKRRRRRRRGPATAVVTKRADRKRFWFPCDCLLEEKKIKNKAELNAPVSRTTSELGD